MDVLRPSLLYIGDRCYRRNPIERQGAVPEQEEETLITEDVYRDEVCDAHSNVEKTATGYRAMLDIPSAYFKFIIGKKAETKRSIENETRTQLKIPRAGEEGLIVINGRDQKGVSSAYTRIEVIVESARQKQPFTHFLSLPLAVEPIIGRFQAFKEEVLKTCDADRGVDGSIFRPATKLHLTLGTLALMNETEITNAKQLLQECRERLIEPIVGGEPLKVSVKGLEYMNDDPNAVDVLYAKVEPQDGTERLQTLADLLVEKFMNAGLMQRQYDRVKLHATIMNTLFRRDPTALSKPESRDSRQDRHNRPRQERESFDATNILKVFGKYDFGSCHLAAVHLSQRHSTSADTYYGCAATLDLT